MLLIFTSVMLILRRGFLPFMLAFLGGLILDIETVGALGATSIFLVGWLFFILLYERKYEIATVPFVLLSSFFGSLLYLLFFGYEDALIQSVVSSVIAVVLFKIL